MIQQLEYDNDPVSRSIRSRWVLDSLLLAGG
jgi:hypothetical protein